MLDSNQAMGPDSEQYRWLEARLAASTARWKFAAKHYRGHHYCLVTVCGDSLSFRMHDLEGNLRDAFDLRKTAIAARSSATAETKPLQ